MYILNILSFFRTNVEHWSFGCVCVLLLLMPSTSSSLSSSSSLLLFLFVCVSMDYFVLPDNYEYNTYIWIYMDIYGGSNISPFISRIFFPLSFNALLTVMEFLGIDITRGWFNTTVSNTEEARTRHLKILTLAFSLVFSQLLCHAMPFHTVCLNEEMCFNHTNASTQLSKFGSGTST